MHPSYRRRPNHFKIYASRRHFAVTLLVVVLPFIFLLIFSRYANIAAGTLFSDVFVSFLRLAVAYSIAAILGWTAAIFFYHGKRGDIALPVFDVLQSFPTFAALPLATFAFGASNATVIGFLVLTIIWPIFFSVVSSLKLAKREWEEVASISGLKGRAYVMLYLWPVSAPGLITGSIIGLGEGWEALVATEIIVGISGGLGGFFQSFSHNPAITTFGILGFLVLIFSINKLVWFPLLKWSHTTMEE